MALGRSRRVKLTKADFIIWFGSIGILAYILATSEAPDSMKGVGTDEVPCVKCIISCDR